MANRVDGSFRTEKRKLENGTNKRAKGMGDWIMKKDKQERMIDNKQ